MKKSIARITSLLNIAVIVTAVVLGILILKRYIIDPRNSGPPEELLELRVGAKFPLADIEWQKNGRTLLLGLSKSCHFCSESAPFYQRLVNEKANHGGFQLMAVFQEPLNEARQYLKEINVELTELRQARLRSLGMKGTPAAVIINRSGEVMGMWLGRLSADQEAQVLSRLRSADEQADQSSLHPELQGRISNEELKRLMASRKDVVVLDVRNRAAYAQDHIQGARNIPIDELEPRALNELSTKDLVVVYCRCTDSDFIEIARTSLVKQGFQQVSVLSE